MTDHDGKCQRCGNDEREATICRRCTRDLERALGDMPWLDEQLALTIARQARFTEASDGGRSAETPLAFHPKASELKSHLRAIVSSWVRLVKEEAPDAIAGDWPRDTLTDTARYLHKRLTWIRQHQAAAQAVDDIRAAVARAKLIVDTPRNRTTFTVGPCPETWDGGASCIGEVRAYIPATDDERPHLDCTFCKATWEPEQWLRLGRRILERQAQEQRMAALRRAVFEQDA